MLDLLFESQENIQSDPAFVKWFIIDKEMNKYYKWTFNGNKVALELPAENAGLDWDTGQQESKLAYIKGLPDWSMWITGLRALCPKRMLRAKSRQHRRLRQLTWNNLFKRIDERSAHDGEIWLVY